LFKELSFETVQLR